jgi:hypothetical protein
MKRSASAFSVKFVIRPPMEKPADICGLAPKKGRAPLFTIKYVIGEIKLANKTHFIDL